MKVLIFVSGYPSQDNLYNCSWAHTRSVEYLKQGILPIVINFGTKHSYNIDGVSVHPESDVFKLLKDNDFSVLLMHSPNIRKHFPLASKIRHRFKKIFIFCHGTESMWINKDYPKPYNFMKPSFTNRMFRYIYDLSKFIFFKRFLKENIELVDLIFVSSWMKNIFKKNVLDPDKFNISNHIISNTIHSVFLNFDYSTGGRKNDFITIRRFDDSKYAIDLVVKFAMNNPQYSFHVYGKGEYFKHYDKPKNMYLFDNFVKQEDIPKLLDNYKCALMPTRCDAQGVMVCEMATYGIPVITTNIEINNDMLNGFENVFLIDEYCFESKVNIPEVTHRKEKNKRFDLENTVNLEINLLKKYA